MPIEAIRAVTNLVDSLGVKDIVQLGVSLAERGVDAGSKTYARRAEERKDLVEVAEVYSSDYRLKLDDAKRWLEEDGLRTEAVAVQPDVVYKDCSDLEVVATNFKLGQKVKPGTRIVLKYVTADVIESSQKLYEESEKQKTMDQQKKIEQAEKNRQKIDKTVETVQDGLSSAVANAHKGISGVISKMPKRNKDKNS